MISPNLPSLPDLQTGSTPASKSSHGATKLSNGSRFAEVLDEAAARTETTVSREDATAKKTEDVRSREAAEYSQSQKTGSVHNSDRDSTKTESGDSVQSDGEGSAQPAEAKDTRAADETGPVDKTEESVALPGAGEKGAPKVDVAQALQTLPPFPAMPAGDEVGVAVSTLDEVTVNVPATASPLTSQTSAVSPSSVVQTGASVPTATTANAFVTSSPNEGHVEASTRAAQQAAVSADAVTVDASAKTVSPEAAPTITNAATTAATAQTPKEGTAKTAASHTDVPLVSALHSAQKAEATQATVATSSAKSAQPAPEPYRQVVQVVAPLRGRDGDYNITLSLNPENLGRVDISLNISSNTVNMQMQADNPNARQMLRDSMNDLRNELNGSGLNAGTLDVGSQDAGKQSQQSTQNNAAISSSDGDMTLDDEEFFARLATAPSARNASADGRLDALA